MATDHCPAVNTIVNYGVQHAVAGAAVNVTLAALDKVQTMRQLGVGTPDDCLMCAADVDQGDEDAEMVKG
jgi:hypothetical protein